MKNLSLILFCITIIACGQEMEKDEPLTEPIASELPIKIAQREMERIGHRNLLKLKTKQYRVTPLDVSVGYAGGGQWVEEEDAYIRSIYFGNVDREQNFVPNDDFPAHTAKVMVIIDFKRSPYKLTKEGENAFQTGRKYDGLAILIDSKTKSVSDGFIGGGKGNLFRHKLVKYKGSVIKNLDKPDIIFDFANIKH